MAEVAIAKVADNKVASFVVASENPCTMHRSGSRDGLIAAAREIAADLREGTREIEQSREIPPRFVERFLDTGIWTMGHAPAVDILTRFEVIEIIAQADASAGWCTMLAGGNGGSGPPGFESAEATEIWGDKRIVTAGASRPSGKAIVVDGGFRVTGVWPFMSGCRHASWFSGTCVVYDGDKPVTNAAGKPKLLCAYFPKEDAEILDTWRTMGMRGTGSHDVRCTDIFVPTARALDFFSLKDQPAGAVVSPFAAVPGIGLIYHAPVVIGIAQHAYDVVREAVSTKFGARGNALIREAQVQATIARAEALIGSARSYAWTVLSDICEKFDTGATPDERDRALCRLSITHAHTACVQAVDILYEIAGGGAAFEKNQIEQLLRDMRTASQHIVADYKTYEYAGRMLLGMSPGEPMF